MSIIEHLNFFAAGWSDTHPKHFRWLSWCCLSHCGNARDAQFFVIEDLKVEKSDLKSQVLVLQTSIEDLRNANAKLAQKAGVRSENQSGGITAETVTVGKFDPPERELTESLKAKLLETKAIGGWKCVYVDSKVWEETTRFAQKIVDFLQSNGIRAFPAQGRLEVAPSRDNPVTPERVLVVMNKPTDNQDCSAILVYSQPR